jgi:hypothetical protein
VEPDRLTTPRVAASKELIALAGQIAQKIRDSLPTILARRLLGHKYFMSWNFGPATVASQ